MYYKTRQIWVYFVCTLLWRQIKKKVCAPVQMQHFLRHKEMWRKVISKLFFPLLTVYNMDISIGGGGGNGWKS